MSYYYEDASYYCYSVPARRDNTSHLYHSTSAQLVDTSQYSFSTPTRNNITPNSVYYNNSSYNATSWSSPLSSGIVHARELEAYAEAASNRTYSWDEIHPAYRDHPTDNYCDPIQPNVDDDEYYEDVTDEELAEMNRRCMEYQRQKAEKEVRDVEDNVVPVVDNNVDRDEDVDEPTMEVERGEDREDHDDECEDVTVDEPLPPLLLSHPKPTSPHHISSDNFITTPPPDIRTPNPHPPSPNIGYALDHLHPHPPDMVTPPPLPLKPNIPCSHSSDVRGRTLLGGG
jgi:hypothetical protein